MLPSLGFPAIIFNCLKEDLGRWGPQSCCGPQFRCLIRISLGEKAHGEGKCGVESMDSGIRSIFSWPNSSVKLGVIHPKQLLHICVLETEKISQGLPGGTRPHHLMLPSISSSPDLLPDPPYLLYTQRLILYPPPSKLHSRIFPANPRPPLIDGQVLFPSC